MQWFLIIKIKNSFKKTFADIVTLIVINDSFFILLGKSNN